MTATMLITTYRQDIELSPVSSVVVTAITADSTAGDYYRDIRIFDEDSSQVLTVRVRSTDQAALKIDTGELQF